MQDPIQAKKREQISWFLDPFMNGVLPEGTSIALVGPPGAGKTIFCESWAQNFLQNRQSCIYVTTDRVVDDVIDDLQRLGSDVKRFHAEKRLTFVDGYGWLAGNSKGQFHVESLANLPELTILIERAASHLDGQGLLIFDSISPLPLYNPESDVVKFMQALAARMKDRKYMSLYVVHAGVHTAAFYNALAYLTDGIFNMKKEVEQGRILRYFRISNLRFTAHGMKWLPFIIESDRSLKFQNPERSI